MGRSLEDLKKIRMKALVITAHPDDESLFIGGTMAEFKKWRWTVLCVADCDERYNKRRRRELLQACRIYKKAGCDITPFMLGIAKQKGRFVKKDIKEKIRDFIDGSGVFDIIFTHNNKGEYGHKTHGLVHDVVKRLKLRNVYDFYLPGYGKMPARIQAVGLSRGSRRAKMRAINVYLNGSQKTNLSRLKKLLSHALKTKTEWFYRAN